MVDTVTIGIIAAVIAVVVVLIVILIKVIKSKGGSSSAKYKKSISRDYDDLEKLSSHFKDEKGEDLLARRVGIKAEKIINDVESAVKSGDSGAIKESAEDAEKLAKYEVKQEKKDLRESKRVQDIIEKSIKDAEKRIEGLKEELAKAKHLGKKESIEYLERLVAFEEKEIELRKKAKEFSNKVVLLNKRERKLEKEKLSELKNLPILEVIDDEKVSPEELEKAKSESLEAISALKESFKEEMKRMRQEILVGVKEGSVIEEIKVVTEEKAEAVTEEEARLRKYEVKAEAEKQRCLSDMKANRHKGYLTPWQEKYLMRYIDIAKHDGKLVRRLFDNLLEEFTQIYYRFVNKTINKQEYKELSMEAYNKAIGSLHLR